MTNVGIVTQARMTSTRLPGKVLLQATGRTMLEHHVERLRWSRLPVFVATSTNQADDPIIEIANSLDVKTFRGSENDVLSRFAGAAQEFELDAIVRVTSDCPLIDGELVRRGVDEFIGWRDDWAFVSNTLERTYPRGFDFEVFSARALQEADAKASSASDREHVTPYLYQNRSGQVKHYAIRRDIDASRYRVTLDTEEDLAVISRLFDEHQAASLDVEQIVEVLKNNDDLVALNAQIEQKKLGE